MSESNKSKPAAGRRNWFSYISPSILARAGAPSSANRAIPGDSSDDICISVSRHSGEEPPEDKIKVIGRFR